jgi:hypothetical protein
MNIFLIINEKSNMNSLRIDLIKKEIVDKLTKCKITIFNNSDLNIKKYFFENDLLTVINKKYNSLYLSCILDYIIKNYEIMPDKFIFWQIFNNYSIDKRIVNYIKQIDNGDDCHLFYISNYISIFDFNTVFASVENDEDMLKKKDFYKYEHLQRNYLLLFGEEICENTTFNYGEGYVTLMNKTKIHKNPIDYYIKILNYLTYSENIERDEYYITIFMEKIFTGVFTNNMRISHEEIEEEQKKKLEEETRRMEENNKKLEEETRRKKEETRRMEEEETRKMKEEETRRMEEEEEEKKLKEIKEIENLIGPIEEIEEIEIEIESSIGSFGLLEIMENDMMFDINIIEYVDNTIKMS